MDLHFAAQVAAGLGCWVVASCGVLWLWHLARKDQDK